MWPLALCRVSVILRYYTSFFPSLAYCKAYKLKKSKNNILGSTDMPLPWQIQKLQQPNIHISILHKVKPTYTYAYTYNDKGYLKKAPIYKEAGHKNKQE